MRDIMIHIIKSLDWFPGVMLGSCLYLFFNEFRPIEKMKRHYEKKHSDFQKKYFDKEKE